MAGTYTNRRLELFEAAKEVFHSAPTGVQRPIRGLRRFCRQAASLLNPVKLARTLMYHSRFFEISNTKFPGLHLGSGNQKIKGFLNIDANPLVACDVVAGLERLKVKSQCVEVVYASHVFEHFPRSKTNALLTEWFRVLKRSGTLFLCVPDLESLARLYLQNLPAYESNDGRDIVDLTCNVIYGGQGNKYDFHYYGYSYTTLKALLLSVGFVRVEPFDRQSLGFAEFPDGGGASIGDFAISLNVKATK